MAPAAYDEKTVDGTTQEKPATWSSREFGEIYEEYSRQIYYLALRMLSDPAQAEDATHDIFLKAFRSMQQFRGDSAVRTWLYRIAINHCRNLIQSWHRRTMVTNVDDAFWEHSSASADTPLQIIETAELGKRIQKTLDRLPDEYRLLLLLVADRQLGYDQIAELTGQTSDAVRGKLYRARKAFAELFRKSE